MKVMCYGSQEKLHRYMKFARENYFSITYIIYKNSTLFRSTVRGAWHSGVRAAEGVAHVLGVPLNAPGTSVFTTIRPPVQQSSCHGCTCT